MPLKTEELSVVDKGGFLIEKTLWGVIVRLTTATSGRALEYVGTSIKYMVDGV